MKSAFTTKVHRETNESSVIGLTVTPNYFQSFWSFNSTAPCLSQCTVTIPSRHGDLIFPAAESKLITMQRQIGQLWQTLTSLLCAVFQAAGKFTGLFMTIRTAVLFWSYCLGCLALQKRRNLKCVPFQSDCHFEVM